MKRFLASLGLAAMVAAAAPAGSSFAAAQPSSSMGIRILNVKSTITMTATHPVALLVRVRGITLVFPRPKQKPFPGVGHIQVYLDSIPASAYTKATSRNLVVAAASPNVIFQVSRPWLKHHKGHHHLILALAKNNNVLYHATTAKVAVIVK